jgi:hypothetical protein
MTDVPGRHQRRDSLTSVAACGAGAGSGTRQVDRYDAKCAATVVAFSARARRRRRVRGLLPRRCTCSSPSLKVGIYQSIHLNNLCCSLARSIDRVVALATHVARARSRRVVERLSMQQASNSTIWLASYHNLPHAPCPHGCRRPQTKEPVKVRYGYHLATDCRKAEPGQQVAQGREATIIHNFNTYTSITASKAKPFTNDKQADILLSGITTIDTRRPGTCISTPRLPSQRGSPTRSSSTVLPLATSRARVSTILATTSVGAGRLLLGRATRCTMSRDQK